MAFLEVLTRTYHRPDMLAANTRSLLAQTDDDWIQTILPDNEGRGVPWAQERLEEYAPFISGEYVWILDDDDRCIRDTFVEELKGIVIDHRPDVIMVRMDHKERGVLPPAGWRQAPVHGLIGCSAYVVRREVFQLHAGVWGGAKYHSDFEFIRAVYGSGANVYWHDVIASEVQRISLGAPA